MHKMKETGDVKDTTWTDYMIVAANHSKSNARHWFRYLRKDIDNCGVTFSAKDVEQLYHDLRLTPFQRVSLKAAFQEGSSTQSYIQSLNKKVESNTLSILRVKFETNKISTTLENGNTKQAP